MSAGKGWNLKLERILFKVKVQLKASSLLPSRAGCSPACSPPCSCHIHAAGAAQDLCIICEISFVRSYYVIRPPNNAFKYTTSLIICSCRQRACLKSLFLQRNQTCLQDLQLPLKPPCSAHPCSPWETDGPSSLL